jgi:hypothetical protein
MSATLTDAQFFIAHPDRYTRIRLPNPGEEEFGFATLGAHDPDRRRILIQRVPDGPHRGMLMPIPMVLFGDETVEDRDDILLPVIHGIMLDARKANDNERRRR